MYQNRSTDQSRAWVPQMPGHSDWRTKPFEDMRTEQQQIWWLYSVAKLQEDEIEELRNEIAQFKAEVQKQLDAMKAEMQQRLKDMEDTIYWLCTGGMHYDITAGEYRSSMARERRHWQMSNPECPTVAQMGTQTVGEWGKHTNGELAVRGRTLFGFDVDYKVAPQMGWAEPEFDPADFLRRDELSNLTADDVAAGKLYAFTKENLPTNLPPIPPYIRRGTVDDLAGLRVLWNQHFVGRDYDVPAADE